MEECRREQRRNRPEHIAHQTLAGDATRSLLSVRIAGIVVDLSQVSSCQSDDYDQESPTNRVEYRKYTATD